MAEGNRWKLRAACFGTPTPNLWFPTFDTTQAEIAQAQDVCHTCPVRELCKHSRPKNAYGIWGGVLYRLDEGDW